MAKHASDGMRTHRSMKPLMRTETTRPNGNRGFGVEDPNSPKRRVYDDPEVEALREKLREHNGIRGLEICDPHEVKRIARIFHRDGFVVVQRPTQRQSNSLAGETDVPKHFAIFSSVPRRRK